MVSLIIPVYNNEPTIQKLYDRLIKVLRELKQSYEIIFIDDGSSDRSFGILESLHNRDKQVKIIKLSRNFGQSQAILAGLKYTKGSIIVTMDADLQYNPEDIPKLLEKIDEGFEAVCGWRKNRQDSLFLRKLPSYFANIFTRIKLNKDIKDIGCSFTALRRSIAIQLKNYGNTVRFYKPLLIKLTDSICEIEVEHYPRRTGRSQYSIIRLIKTALDFVVNFSLKPTHKKSPLFIIERIIE